LGGGSAERKGQPKNGDFADKACASGEVGGLRLGEEVEEAKKVAQIFDKSSG